MTSSLVGSEMCIRDSTRSATPRSGSGGEVMDQVEPPDEWGFETLAWGEPCLLYTSDAADDM
eukprot:6938171-Prorocentrum_lima.AAC.1